MAIKLFERRVCPIALIAATIGASGCTGAPSNGGAFAAELTLLDGAGRSHAFPLGHFPTFERCTEVLEFEISSYERDRGDLVFFTNADYSYGGHRTGELTVSNRIVAARCGDTRVSLSSAGSLPATGR